MTANARPTLTVVAGPNGSGKSTITRSTLTHLLVPIVDPDAIARELHPSAPEQAAVEAGREALKRQAAYVENGASFVVETTLSGAGMLRLMEKARQQGFVVHLLFVATDKAQTNIERVAGRVARGGHHVPDEDVRRRYERSMENLVRAIELADQATITDNSSEQGPREVLVIKQGHITEQADDLPAWVTTYLGTFITRQNRP